MKFILQSLVVLIFSIGIFSSVYGQSQPAKFGKVTDAEVNMSSFEADAEAEAVILFEVGNLRYRFVKDDFQQLLEVHRRIKVLKKEGYDWATVQVPVVQQNGSAKELVSEIKGATYNMENGKMVVHKMEKSAIFNEDMGQNVRLVKFTLPNVKEGSVIEYSYTISSDFYYNFRDWAFQHNVPTLWSEYRTSIPEYFDVMQFSQGYIPFAVNQSGTEPGKISWTERYTSGGGGGLSVERRSVETQEVFMTNNTKHFVQQNIPAFRNERFITTPDDYISKISLQLALIKFPNSPVQPIMNSKEKVAEQLMKRDDFGGFLSRGSAVREMAQALSSGKADDKEKATAIYEYARTNFKFNDEETIWPSLNTAKKMLEVKTGNVADINMTLIAMLREAGVKAYPVILSTRSHGKVNTIYPMLKSFNYLVVAIQAGNELLLADASQGFLPIGMVAYDALGGAGLMLDSNTAEWIELKSTRKSVEMTTVKIKIDGEQLDTDIQHSVQGYFAAFARTGIKEQSAETYLQKKFKKLIGTDGSLSAVEFSNVSDLSSSLQGKCKVATSEFIERNGDVIYINPLLSFGMSENPFKADERKFPVDFVFPYDETLTVSIAIPEGYRIDEMPKQGRMRWQDGSVTIDYLVQASENELQIVSRFSLKRATFEAEEYKMLKDFMGSIVGLHAQQVVLKKKLQ